MSRSDMMAHSIQSLERIILNKDARIRELEALLDECEAYIKTMQCGCENRLTDFTCARCAILAKLRGEKV